MILLGPLLAIAMLVSAALAPFIALAMVLLSERRSSRALAWVGLSTAVGLMTTLPIYCVIITGYGADHSRWYCSALVIGCGSVVVGACMWKLHLDRLASGPSRQPRLATASVALAAVISVALLPWVFGAPLFIGGGEFAEEYPPQPGNLKYYCLHVVPVVAAVGIQAWDALRGKSAAAPS